MAKLKISSRRVPKNVVKALNVADEDIVPANPLCIAAGCSPKNKHSS